MYLCQRFVTSNNYHLDRFVIRTVVIGEQFETVRRVLLHCIMYRIYICR
jgi:hypothetical protein